ncbi:MAG TPA: hypothetical protein DCG47_08640 [Spirochaetaceae bacterium]|jgi:hypothetical protein|nr:hypothetical protein [Spirochaetaceae bacterium]
MPISSFPETLELNYADIEFHTNYLIQTPKRGARINLAAVHDLGMLKIERYGDRPIIYIFDDQNEAQLDINTSLYADHSCLSYGYSHIIVVRYGHNNGDKRQVTRMLIKRTPFLITTSRSEAIALAERLHQEKRDGETLAVSLKLR